MTSPLLAPPSLDPNWFYSSLAQSAASVVGLLGGILATTVQAQQEPAALQRERATEALRVLDAQLRTDHQNLADYRTHAPRQIAATRDAMVAGKTELRFDVFYHPFGNVDGRRSGPPCTQGAIDIEEQRLALTVKLVPILEALLEAKDVRRIHGFMGAAAEFVDTPVEGMGSVVRKLVEFAERAAREFDFLAVRTRTAVWIVLWWVLLIIVLAGLVAPLVELSAHNQCGPIALAGATVFAIGLLVLLAYILVQIRQLRSRGAYSSLLPPKP